MPQTSLAAYSKGAPSGPDGCAHALALSRKNPEAIPNKTHTIWLSELILSSHRLSLQLLCQCFSKSTCATCRAVRRRSTESSLDSCLLPGEPAARLLQRCYRRRVPPVCSSALHVAGSRLHFCG